MSAQRKKGKAEVEIQQLLNCSYFDSLEEMWYYNLKRELVDDYIAGSGILSYSASRTF